VNHGHILRKLGKYEEAEACFEKALILDPTDCENVYVCLALVKMFLRKFEGAIDYLQKALVLDSKNQVAMGLLQDAMELWSYEMDVVNILPCEASSLQKYDGSVFEKRKLDESSMIAESSMMAESSMVREAKKDSARSGSSDCLRSFKIDEDLSDLKIQPLEETRLNETPIIDQSSANSDDMSLEESDSD
jgi:tetratricopeptide (TPR) repeat protein